MAIGPETPDNGDELSAPLSPLYSESSDLEEIGRRSSRCTSTDDPGSSTSSSVAVDSLLSKLRSPLPSESAHKRKIRKNPPKEQKLTTQRMWHQLTGSELTLVSPLMLATESFFALHAGRS